MDNNRKKSSDFYRLMTSLISIDLVILLTARRLTKLALRFLGSILQIVSAMTLGAGILFAYTLVCGKINVPIYVEKYSISMSKPIKEAMLTIDTESRADSLETANIEQKLSNLRNQAQHLELSLRKMEMKYKDFSEIASSNWRDQELADFASEAAGGTVLDVPDTESYYESRHQQSTIFGIPIWQASYFTPRKVIQPWTQAGECWAFKGSNGKITIELAYDTFIDQVTLEHIPASASLTGSINSAPKDLAIYGLIDDVFVKLHSFSYDINGPFSQKFKLEDGEIKFYPIKVILLEIKSNWGHRDYTCIYRFKVHGSIANPEYSNAAYIMQE